MILACARRCTRTHAAYRPGELLRISYLHRKPGSYATGLSEYENIGTNIMTS